MNSDASNASYGNTDTTCYYHRPRSGRKVLIVRETITDRHKYTIFYCCQLFSPKIF